MFNFFPSKCLTDRSIKKLNKNVLQEGENMEKGTVKRRIFISNALMVLTTLVIFLLINMVVVKIYTESIEVELKTSLEQLVDGKDTDNLQKENQDGIFHNIDDFLEDWTVYRNEFILPGRRCRENT